MVLLYLHDHTSKVCLQIDREVFTDEEILEKMKGFMCLGLNVHTDKGKELSTQIKAKAIPFVAIMKVKEDGDPSILSILEGVDVITEESLS